MSLRTIVDAWLTDIQGHVTELADATPHRYAIWSLEMLGDAAAGRHIAIFPVPRNSTSVPWTVGSLPANLEENYFRGIIWEAAMSDVTRLVDDDDANGAWLDLYETVKARLMVQSSTSLGTTGGYTVYREWDAYIVGTVRVMEFGFTVEESRTFTA
jgi:hypothetical protein